MKIDTISLILGAVAGYFLAGMMTKKEPAPVGWTPDISAALQAGLGGATNGANSGRPGVNTAS